MKKTSAFKGMDPSLAAFSSEDSEEPRTYSMRFKEKMDSFVQKKL